MQKRSAAMEDETITFKVPKPISDNFKAFARSKGRTQNGILREWIQHPDIPQIPFPFSRKIDMSDYAGQPRVSKTLRLKPSIYKRFKAYCDERNVDMRDILVSWMFRIMKKDKLPPMQ
jgi:hypothetical protein